MAKKGKGEAAANAAVEPKIEAKMKELVKADLATKRTVWQRDKAVQHFLSIGEQYKAEIIRDLLSEQQPILEHMATMLEQAKTGKLDQAMKGWKKMTGEALKGLGVIMNPPDLKKSK